MEDANLKLEKYYNEFVNNTKKSNTFYSVILNDKDIRDFLYNNSNILELYYEKISDLQRLYYIYNTKKILFCTCGKVRTWRNLKKGYNKTCGNKECVTKENLASVEKYYIENHGVTHLFKTEQFKENLKKTFEEKYGVDNPWKDQGIKDKIKETNKKKFGEDNWLKIKKNRDQVSSSIIKNNKEKRELLIKNNNIPIEIIIFDINKVTLRCFKCLNETSVSPSFFNKKIKISASPCLICDPPLYAESSGEIEIFQYITQIYNKDIIRHDRKIGNGKELDIYLPDIKTAFEFNGIYWHSEIFKEKNYSIEKKEFFKNKGINIINIWEDDWVYKNNIVKSRINNFLGISKKVYARKCLIKEIGSKEERIFLDENHIQGYTPSTIKIGLFYENCLISVMTFGHKRRALGAKASSVEFEMLRFCNKLNTSIIGGASKLFSYFLKNFEYESIISYQDYSWNKGNLYEKLGFTYIKTTSPDYYWCKGNIRFHRYNFRKDKLVKEGFDKDKTENDIMTERKYYKLWGTGNLLWEYKKKSLD